MLYENTLIIKNDKKTENNLPIDQYHIYRILYINHQEDYIIWIHIFDNSLPEQICLTDITLRLSKEELLLFTDPDPFSTLPDTQINDNDTVKDARKKQKKEAPQ